MKKFRGKKVLIAIILVIILILIIKFFSDSKADDLIEINANIIDNTGLLSDENSIILASNEGKIGYSITLPDVINSKKINKYYVENKEVINTTDESNSTNLAESENVSVDNNEEDLEANSIKDSTAKLIEKKPGEKIYLTR